MPVKRKIKRVSRLKNTIAAAKWAKAVSKVDYAVNVLASKGLAFSRTEGIIGDFSHESRREKRKITAAANDMTKFQAVFVNKKKKFKPNDPLKTGHFTPLKLADVEFVQEKSYKQATSSMHLRSALKFTQRTLYDPRLQAHPVRRVLGITSEDAQEWSALTESLWRSEKELKDWDESEQNNYAQLSDMALWSYSAIGEFIAIRRAYFNDPERLTNLSIQILSPFQIQSPMFTSFSRHRVSYYNCDENQIVEISASTFLSDMSEGHYIEHGFEYDGKNREVAIFIRPVTFGQAWERIAIKNDNGFIQVLHGFVQSEPGQKRGIPESATAWHEFMNIKDLCLFELESARLNTVIAGSVTADSNAQPNGQQGGVTEIGQPASWNIAGPAVPLAAYEDPSYSVRAVDSGGFVIQNFTPGYKYTELDTKRPNVKIPEYIDRLLNYIYPSISGLGRRVVAYDFAGSYNASKGVIDLSWKNGIEYNLKQFTSDWHRPNYKAWLAGKVATGEVPAAGWEDPKKRNAWSSMDIITPPKPSLNPKQEADAGKVRVSYGASNGELEAQQQTGTSFEENVERLKSENEKLAEALEPLIELENPEPEAPENDDMDDTEDNEDE